MPVIHGTAPRLTHGQAGFTLVELMVAMVCGIIVTGALFAILEVSLHQTSRITDRVQATQLGRTAMTKVVDELNSACIARKFAPIQEGSTASKLIFITAASEKPVIEYREAAKHEILWTGTYPGRGNLIDKVYPGAGGTWPNGFTWGAPNSVLLAENVYAQREPKEGVKENAPIFRYYKYAPEPLGSSSEAATTLEPQISEPSATEVKSTAAVLISFSTAPTSNNLALGRAAEFSTQVTFAFSTPSSEAKIEDGPCQ